MSMTEVAAAPGMRLIRVFPRRTKATPTDALAYFGPPDHLAEADEIHVDCTFTWDKAAAERLAEQWRRRSRGGRYSPPSARRDSLSPAPGPSRNRTRPADPTAIEAALSLPAPPIR